MNIPDASDCPQDSLDSYEGVGAHIYAYPLNDPDVPLEAAILMYLEQTVLNEDHAVGYQNVVEQLAAIAAERAELERMNRYSPELVEFLECLKRSADREKIHKPADPEDHHLQGEADAADLTRAGMKLLHPLVAKLNEKRGTDDLREWKAHL
jgi:hypothetical protein